MMRIHRIPQDCKTRRNLTLNIVMMKRIFVSIVLVLTVLVMNAQSYQLPPLPLDSAVRMGKLDNGLTYYIRHNEWPEQRANFYIAQKVGSMQEEDDQRGLAHFLEHMCFNGTTHFPGNTLKTYLESIGVKFGQDLNAYTSFDETVYNIDNVPVITNPLAIDSCLLILHDWSHDLLLEDDEIDKERGVINEEWRMRSSASQRMIEKALPILFEGSRYAHRMPIGTMDIVMNFPYEAIRKYYRKWYRPDLQAVIVVGDVNVDEIEAKIKKMFADIAPAPADAAVREYFTVATNDKPIFTVQTDKEQESSNMVFAWKHPAVPREYKNTALYYTSNYLNEAIEGMLGTRLSEIMLQENPPFLGASISFDTDYLITNAMSSSAFTVQFKDNSYKEAIKAVYREMLRAERFGFTVSEYERYRQEYKSSLDHMYERRDKITNGNYVKEYVHHFLDNVAAPGIGWEHENLIKIADMVTVDVINNSVSQLAQQRAETAPVIYGMLPQKDGIAVPTEEEILGILKEVEAEDIEGYKEEVSSEPILDTSRLKGSKIVKEDQADFEFTHLKLKNGINIYVRKTDFSPNSISMVAHSWGGTSLYGKDDYLNASNAETVAIGGWGNFSAIELSKKMAGIRANVSPSIGTRDESMSGTCVKKDLESMLQLTYLAYTSPHKDLEVFNSTMSRSKAGLENVELDPQTAFGDTLRKVAYNDNYMVKRTRPEDIDKLDYDKMIQIYKERFANAGDFTFFFIGDIDIDSVKPLFEKYLGSLPVRKGKEKYKTVDLRLQDGELTNVFEKVQETPNAIEVFMWHEHMKPSLKGILTLDYLKQILQMVYLETVREDEGGAYSVGVGSSFSEYPEEYAMIQVQLPTAPEKRAYMEKIILKGIDDMVANGPKAEDVQKVREYMNRSYQESVKSNGYWLSAIKSKVTQDKNYVDGYLDCVNSITAQDVQDMATKIFKSGNRIIVGMTSPVEETK